MRWNSLSPLGLAAMLAALASPAVGPAFATPARVEGRVSDANTGDPIAGCAIDVLLDGNAPSSTPPATASEGVFALDLPALFGAKAAKATTLVIEFRKSGYSPSRRCLTLSAASTSIETQDVRLAPTSGASSLDAALKKQLDGHKSPTGRTVYLFQYMVPPGGSIPARDTLTWMLSWSVKLAINGQFNALLDSVTQQHKPIDVDTLNCAVNTANSERVLSIGRYLNALAMIDGAAVPRSGAGSSSVMALTSEFQTVRKMPPYSPSSTSLVNSISSDLFDAPGIGRELGEDWRSLGVLSMIARELEQAKSPRNAAMLCDLSRIVVAQLSTMRPGRTAVGDHVIRQLQLIQKDIGSPCP